MVTSSELANNLRSIKKYPGRRLYDTQESKYIAFEDVKKLMQDGYQLKIIDLKTGLDLTRNILLQIIINQENSFNPVFTTETLKSIIRFYGNSMQTIMASQLEESVKLLFSIQAVATENSANLISTYFDGLKK